MNTIPIFDCLTHPSLNGDWILPEHSQKSKMEILEDEMKTNNVKWGFAVGMDGIGDYDEKKFLEMIKKSEANLFPVAYYPFQKISGKKKISEWVSGIKKMGFTCVKIHPRLSGIKLDNSNLVELVKASASENLAVLLCTYFYSSDIKSTGNNIDLLIEFLQKIEDCKIILLHSGSVRLLEAIEVARAFKNVLLDLSFTLNKYEGSSLDLDISFAFNKFDRRICVGSDFPNFSLNSLRRRFEKFSENLNLEQKENIAYKNLFKFLDLPGYEIK
jgi:predicted TIM-barrel fold metal-dependent hydrolase